jgi:hypothetical protein
MGGLVNGQREQQDQDLDEKLREIKVFQQGATG